MDEGVLTANDIIALDIESHFVGTPLRSLQESQMKHASNGQTPEALDRQADSQRSSLHSSVKRSDSAPGNADNRKRSASTTQRKAARATDKGGEQSNANGRESLDKELASHRKASDSIPAKKGKLGDDAATELRDPSDDAAIDLHEGAAKPESNAGAKSERMSFKLAEAEPIDPAAYPYGAEGMLEISTASMPTTSHQQFRENPRVIYPNAESLSRPLTIPDSSRIGVIALVLAACLIAAGLLYAYFDATANEPKRQQALLEEQLSKDVTLNLPSLISFVDMDDAEIAAALQSTGCTLYDRKPVGSGDVYETIKLPDDVALADAAALYLTGIDNLTAPQAASLLNGSWDLTVDRKSSLNMSVHYADFASGDTESAISNAIAAEGLERGEINDSGDDDGFGNAYSTGTIMVSGDTYSWTVSAIPLSKVYSVSGMPDDAIYVGVRIKATS